MKIIFSIIVFFVLTFFSLTALDRWLLGPVATTSHPVLYVKNEETIDVIGELARQNIIRNANAFTLVYLLKYGDQKIEIGGYNLDTSMTSRQIMKKLVAKPDLVWISIREGLRKEQIGEIVGAALEWSRSELDQWNNAYTVNSKSEYAEGVYFPDRYLIPRVETPKEIADRFISRFNEKFAPYLDQFTAKNIQWTTGIKIASLIQREAGGVDDMKIISGVIWNRLEKDMRLEIDATMQYTRGKIDDRWWGAVDLAQKKSESLYNTYRHKGLPPTPIANPGLAAIEAALNPADTPCIFYLHDSSKEIHCAETYEEHLHNIEKFL